MPKPKPMPKTVKIGAAVYTFDNSEENWHSRVINGHVTIDTWGETDHKLNQVHIRAGQSLSQEQHTVIHEVLHLIWFYSLSDSVMGQVPHEDKEEYMVGALEPFMLMVLRDNPDLLEYLTQPLAFMVP